MTSSLPVPSGRTPAIDHLRAFLTLLVVAHHAILAYFPYAPPVGAFDGWMLWGAFPIVDTARGKGLDLLVLWNDSFFMALMFLISGLFVVPSLVRKGAGHFLRDRLLRLGLPFVAGAALLAPLAYYPAYLQRAAATPASGFWSAWFALGKWPAGPAWFLWLLLAFGATAALVHRLLPGGLQSLARLGDRLRVRPFFGYIALLVAALLTYPPACRLVDAQHWFNFGPFWAQTSRVALYAAFFWFGIVLGAPGRLDDFVAAQGRLARRWIPWQVAAGLVFAGFVTVLIISINHTMKGAPSLGWDIGASVALAITAVTTSYCLLSYFARKCGRPSRLWTSLSANAFAIYVIHYGIVSWTQYGLLPVAWPGLAKATIVTLFSIAASWAVAAGLRRLPGLRRIL